MNKTYTVTLADEYTVGGKIGVPVTIDGNHTAWIRTGIELTPYTEPDLDAIKKKAYHNGLSDAWECARKLMLDTNHGGLTNFEIEKIFGVDEEQTIINYSASECIEKIRQYEQRQKEDAYEKIKVGDEVVSRYSNARAIVVSILNDTRMDMMNVIRDCGDVDLVEMASFKRSGRHFPEVAELLKKMQEES